MPDCTIEEGLKILKEYGLDSIPGGGAEIFDEELRKISATKNPLLNSGLKFMKLLTDLGFHQMPQCFMVILKTYSHRIDHMERLRALQDKTGGFNAFIPLKYKKVE